MSRWLCLLMTLALSYGPISFAHAEPASAETDTAEQKEPDGYRDAVTEALREFAANNFEESRSLFARAHALYPNARTHRGLGFAEFELRNYGESIGQLTAALRSRVRPLTPELRTETERMLARANSFVARVVVDVRPRTVKVLLDGVTLEVAPDAPLLLQVGDHELQFGAPGFLGEKRRLSVKGGEKLTLTVVLAPKVEEPSAEAAVSPRADERLWHRSPWLWASVGVLALGAAAGGAGYALTRPERSPQPYRGTAGLPLEGP